MTTLDPSEISPDFRWNKYDAQELGSLLCLADTPRAIRKFSCIHRGLSDYAYWFTLGTLWVSDPRGLRLEFWRRLFASDRPNRETSLMKPAEVKRFRDLPENVIAFRAHRVGEEDWISYSLNLQSAAAFAARYQVREIVPWRIPKADIIALFLRREELEILVLDRSRAVRLPPIPIIGDDHEHNPH